MGWTTLRGEYLYRYSLLPNSYEKETLPKGMSLGLLFALLTLSLIQVPLLLGRYSEETHIVVNPTYQIA